LEQYADENGAAVMLAQRFITMEEEIEKRYHTIGEVAAMLNESPSLIRFWEKEFDVLRPSKTEGGTRKYSEKDIRMLRMIHHLVKENGYTLQGAAEYIRRQPDAADTAQVIDSLKRVRSFLAEIGKRLDG
jgi:DNA-binding transcriptional MerR regulator